MKIYREIDSPASADVNPTHKSMEQKKKLYDILYGIRSILFSLIQNHKPKYSLHLLKIFHVTLKCGLKELQIDQIDHE